MIEITIVLSIFLALVLFWDLRCFIREQMIAYIHSNFPNALARTRVDYQESMQKDL